MIEQRIERARILMNSGRLKEAARELALALAEDPDHMEAQGLTAYVEMRQGLHTQAAKSADRAIALAPDDEWAHFMAGIIAGAAGRIRRAKNHLRDALRLDPGHARTYAALAQIEAETNRYQEALDLTTRGLELEPELTALLNTRATALAGLHRKEEASAALQRSLAVEPENPETLSLLARLKKDQNLHSEAEHLFRLALRGAPADTEVQRELAGQIMLRNPVVARAHAVSSWMKRMTTGKGFWLAVLISAAGQGLLQAAGIRLTARRLAETALALIAVLMFAAWAWQPAHRDAEARALVGERKLSWKVGAMLAAAAVFGVAGLVANHWGWHVGLVVCYAVAMWMGRRRRG